MVWWSWALVASACAIIVEYLNRSHVGSWVTVLPKTGPIFLLLQLALFYTWRDSPTWYLGWICFALGTTVFRGLAVAATSPGEVASWPQVVGGVVVMFVGSFLVKYGLR